MGNSFFVLALADSSALGHLSIDTHDYLYQPEKRVQHGELVAIYKSLDGRVPPYLLAVISGGLRDRVLIYDTDEGRIDRELSAGIAQGFVSAPLEWKTLYDDSFAVNLPDGAELVGFADDAAWSLSTAKTTWEVGDRGNEALYHVGEWFADYHLELARHRRERMVVTRRKSFQMTVFTINGHEILLTRELKSMGVRFIDKRS